MAGVALRFGKEKGFYCCLLPVKLGSSPIAGGAGGGGVEEKAIFIPFSKLDELYKLHISLAISLGETERVIHGRNKTEWNSLHTPSPSPSVLCGLRPCPVMCVFLPLMAPVCVLLPIWDIY